MWDALRPSWVEVDLAQWAANLEAVTRHVRPAVTLPVIKADAYGHGAVACARVAQELGCQRLAVAILDEALELRRAGIAGDLLVLGYTPPPQVRQALEQDITLTVYDSGLILALEEEAARRGRRARLHLKVESGMQRIGVAPGAPLDQLLQGLRRACHLQLEGVFTHFAAADEDEEFTQTQLGRFQRAVEQVEAAGFRDFLRHTANSAGILDHPAAHLDLVRPGLILYGYYPSPQVSRSVAVKPPLRWYARIVQVKEVLTGETVGYNRTYQAPAPVRVATLPVGYADGYPRLLSGRGVVYLEDQPAPVIGRVCMDQFMVDVTGIAGARPGDRCTLLGPQHDAEAMSHRAQTIPHEILTGISPRVPRRYCAHTS